MWIVKRQPQAAHIESHLIALDTPHPSIHNFDLLNRFMKQGWATLVILGPDRGRSIRDLFAAHLPRTKAGQSADSCPALPFFDTRKMSVSSETLDSVSKI